MYYYVHVCVVIRTYVCIRMYRLCIRTYVMYLRMHCRCAVCITAYTYIRTCSNDLAEMLFKCTMCYVHYSTCCMYIVYTYVRT